MSNNIKLYGTKTCTYCKIAKDFFEEKGIKFSYTDIGDNAEVREEVTLAAKASAVPIIKIDDEYFVGWDKEKIKEALGIN